MKKNSATKGKAASKGPVKFYHPSVTADIICVNRDTVKSDECDILMIRRSSKTMAFPGALALPGGFMDASDESIEACAVRELREETGIVAKEDDLNLIGVHTKRGRDPRGPVHSTSFAVMASWVGSRGGDDAAEIVPIHMKVRRPMSGEKDKWCVFLTMTDGTYIDAEQIGVLAFDHADIIRQFVLWFLEVGDRSKERMFRESVASAFAQVRDNINKAFFHQNMTLKAINDVTNGIVEVRHA